MSKRVPIAERLPCQRLADDGHEGPIVDVAVREIAAAQERNAQRIEVARARQPEPGGRQFPEVACKDVLAFDRVRAVRAVLTRGQSHRSSGGRYVGELAQTSQHVVKEASDAQVVVETGIAEVRPAR